VVPHRLKKRSERKRTRRFCGCRAIAWDGYADLASKPEVYKLIWEAVEDVNRRLASYETIKKIALLDHDFSQETGELTPKMSIKRKVVEANNRELVEGFYEQTMERV
jgi:long-chain acyl-CoA synthetase